MEIYINGISAISPQKTYDNSSFLEDVIEYSEDFLTVIKPDYKEFIKGNVLRRMSNIIRMGVVSARMAMQEASVENPDAIIVGTGLGCMTDTEKFLNRLLENKETLLTPTSFIQSTHNTVGAQIAVMVSCNNYNMTYVNQNMAFEISLLDALMMFEEGGAKNILVGGVDEITPENHELKKRIDAWKIEPTTTKTLLNYKTKGCLAGEGSTFTVLSKNKTAETYAKFLDVLTIYKATKDNLKTKLFQFLEKNNLTADDIDVVVTGNNGDFESDEMYNQFTEKYFPKSTQVVYKHLIGEHGSASAFGFWLAAKILKTQTIPEIVNFRKKEINKINNILVYNFDYYFKNNYSFVLLQQV